jgi:hypothetical protein
MPKSLFTFSLAISAALLASACARGPVDLDTGEIFDTRNLPEQKFVVGDFNGEMNARPVPITSLTDAGLKNVLRKLAQEDGRPGKRCDREKSLEKCVDNLKNVAAVGKFRGLSGITGRVVLDVIENRIGSDTNKNVATSGKILEKCLHDTSLPGYYYDKRTKHLRLCVVMTTEIGPEGKSDNLLIYQYFHVEAKKALVDKRASNPDDIFPAAAVATGLVLKETPENANFGFKLYAAGNHIEVKNYWEAKALANQSQPPWIKYTENFPNMPPEIAAYFQKDKDACVDMMFENYPPVTLPSSALAGQYYCLGRCKNPPIVNTK